MSDPSSRSREIFFEVYEDLPRHCHGLLRRGGYLAFTDAVWRRQGKHPTPRHQENPLAPGALRSRSTIEDAAQACPEHSTTTHQEQRAHVG